MYTDVSVTQGGNVYLENGTGASSFPNISVTGTLEKGQTFQVGATYLIKGQPLLDTHGVYQSEGPKGTYNFENVE